MTRRSSSSRRSSSNSKRRAYEVQNHGPSSEEAQRLGTDYPNVAVEVSEAVARSEHVRAAQCHDTFSADRARKSNNAQILTVGQRVIGPELAKTVMDACLKSEFGGGSSSARRSRRWREDGRCESSRCRTYTRERRFSGPSSWRRP